MFHILITITVMFLLSLSGSYILFKILKSVAVIQNSRYQAGGALAGFLLLFSILSLTYRSLHSDGSHLEEWTIIGEVSAIGEKWDSHVTVRVMPSPRDLLGNRGNFHIRNVKIQENQVKNGVLPDLHFEGDGIESYTLFLEEGDYEVLHKSKRIIIKKPIPLYSEVKSESESASLR